MIYKNILKEEDSNIINEVMSSPNFAWHYNSTNVPEREEHNMWHFTHWFYRNNEIQSPYYNLMLPIIKFIEKTEPTKELKRIKANLYTNQHKNIKYDAHVDQPCGETEALIGIYSVNTCNGGTVVNEEMYKSESNQLILFDNISHYGITQTDTQIRMCINFNFIR